MMGEGCVGRCEGCEGLLLALSGCWGFTFSQHLRSYQDGILTLLEMLETMPPASWRDF